MKPSLAFDTAALVSLGHTDLVGIIIQNYNIVVTQTILDELIEISKFNDNHAIAASKWMEYINQFQLIDWERLSTGEEELFNICQKMGLDLVSDDVRAVKRYGNQVDCFFSVHIIYALFVKEIISRNRAVIEIGKMRRERTWKENSISIAARMLFR
ncbi:MAG: hypothetical protein ACMUIG_00305 [Thermoplasmatota archaeon]